MNNRPDFFSATLSGPPYLVEGQTKAQSAGAEQARQAAAQEASQSFWDQAACGHQGPLCHLAAPEPANPLYNRGIIPQARQAAEASLAAYQTGTLDFSRLYQNQIALYNAELKLQEYLKDFEETWAELEWLVGRNSPAREPEMTLRLAALSGGDWCWGLGSAPWLLAALYCAGFRVMRQVGPAPAATAEGKPLCYVSPTNPNFIRFAPGRTKKAMNWCRSIPPQPRRQVSRPDRRTRMSPPDGAASSGATRA